MSRERLSTAVVARRVDRPRLRRFGWLSLAASVALVLVSVMLADARSVAAEVLSADYRWAVATFAIYLVQLGLLGLRWSIIARKLGIELNFTRAAGEYAVSILVNQVVPSGLVGDGLRAVRHARAVPSRSLQHAVEALALDRASGQLALWLVVLVTAPLGFATNLVDSRAFAAGAALLGLLSLGVWIAASRVTSFRSAVGRARLVLLRAISVLLHPKSAMLHLPLSLAFVMTLLLQLDFAARALGVELRMNELFWLGPLILGAASLPTSLGGWGFREGTSAFLFGASGLVASTGLSVSIVFGVFSLLASLGGFLLWLGVQVTLGRAAARAARGSRARS